MKLQYPVPAASLVTQTFAEHEQARRKNGWKYYNGGIDYAVPPSTPIKAAADGRVTRADWDGSGYGYHVRIQHAENYLTLYAHLIDFQVHPGDVVEAGQVIGHSGNTGNSTGPHLHFEARLAGKAVDPGPLLVEEPPAETVIGPQFCVSTETLNVRAGPGVQCPVRRVLHQGDLVTAQLMSGEVWLKIGPDEWVAWAYGQDILLRQQ